MRIATFSEGAGRRIGLVEGETVLDVSAVDTALPATTAELLALGAAGLERAAAAAGRAPRLALADVRLEAPVQPRKFLALGINYAAHVEELRVKVPDLPLPAVQVWFNKQVTCVNGPYNPIHRPRVSAMLDYEGELAVVIGARCRHVPQERAHEVIAGLTICNDVSVRDWQMASVTQTMGKSFDTHGPIGPWIVTLDEFADWTDLRVQTFVNGERRQDFRTSEMIFAIPQMIAHLSTAFTLEPGDVLTTGTSVGNGVLRDPPQLLKAGDRVRVEIEGIGAIENEVVEEPDQPIA